MPHWVEVRVGPDHLAAEWARVVGWLAPALEQWGTHRPSDVLDQIINGHAQLWANEGAAGVTQLVPTPLANICRYWLGGGEMEALKALDEPIEAWARQQGCTRIEIHGRRGWERALRGYRSRGVMLTREIE